MKYQVDYQLKYKQKKSFGNKKYKEIFVKNIQNNKIFCKNYNICTKFQPGMSQNKS
jgi:hypothetical protein